MTDDRLRVTDDLVAEIAARFGLPCPQAWQLLSSSWTTNLRLDFGDSVCVARVHQPWTDHDRLAAIQQVRRSAHRAGLPTLLPITAPDGETIVTLANGALAELEPYVVWDRGMKTPDLLVQGFAALGRLHDVLGGLDLPAEAMVAPRANHLSFEQAADLTRQGADRIRTWCDPALSGFADEAVRHIDTVTAAEEPLAQQQISQLVHGDFWDNNVLFAGDDLVGLIDFDFMAIRWRVDDLALPLYFFLRNLIMVCPMITTSTWYVDWWTPMTPARPGRCPEANGWPSRWRSRDSLPGRSAGGCSNSTKKMPGVTPARLPKSSRWPVSS